MSTIKTKNIQQKVISGTTQPLKIGGILEDGSDAKISIDTSGNLTASNLTATLNGLLTTNGQIKFPATQNSSTNPNTLDDYEEGTWSPVLTASTTNPSLGTASGVIGRYIKIGKIVNFYIYLESGGTGIATGSGKYFISLPMQEGTNRYWNPVGSFACYQGGFYNGTAILYDANHISVIVNGEYWSSANVPVGTNANLLYVVSGSYEALN